MIVRQHGPHQLVRPHAGGQVDGLAGTRSIKAHVGSPEGIWSQAVPILNQSNGGSAPPLTGAPGAVHDRRVMVTSATSSSSVRLCGCEGAGLATLTDLIERIAHADGGTRPSDVAVALSLALATALERIGLDQGLAAEDLVEVWFAE